jgi:DNA repair protein SbcD/Mre11
VLHIGDVHLGVELYGRPMPEKGHGTRVADFLAALDRALELATEADVVLFPGDIYRNCDPSPTVQREFAARIRRAARAVPVVIIPGNHDLPNAYGRASSIDIFRVLEVENVHVLRQPELLTLSTRGGELIVAGMPFLPRSRLITQDDARGKTIAEVVELMRSKLIDQIDDLAAQVRETREDLGEDLPAVLMTHYTIQGAVFGGYGKGALLAPEVDLPLSSVRRSEFDYVALAHIHKYQTVPMRDLDAQPPVVYAGSIERVDFGEEGEDKVVVLAEVTRGRAAFRTVSLNPRPFVTVRVEADEADPVRSVVEAIEAKGEQVKGAVVRVIYSLAPGHPNVPEREVRAALQGVSYVAGIRRETVRQENRARNQGLTTQLTPKEALEEYLKTQPQLETVKEDLLARGEELIARVEGRSEAA